MVFVAQRIFEYRVCKCGSLQDKGFGSIGEPEGSVNVYIARSLLRGRIVPKDGKELEFKND